MNLTKEYILSCYDKTKRLAKKSFEKGRYNRSLKYINIAARIAYQFNWIYRDDDLEELLANISKQTISKRNHYTPIENRYVLYVASMIDNRGEIQQYLRALIACEGELLVIVEKYGKEAAATIAEIKAYPKAKIYALQGDETDVESNAQKLYDKIVNFRPSKLFMHLRPERIMPFGWDANVWIISSNFVLTVVPCRRKNEKSIKIKSYCFLTILF